MGAFERREIVGAAVGTTINGSLTTGSTSITLTASTGWPTGGTGPWTVVINRGGATEEQVDIASRSSLVLTVNGGAAGRGFNGTTAAAHNSGETIEVIIDKRIADESNNLVHQTLGSVTTKGDLLPGSAANTLTRLAVGTNNYPLVADSTQTTGLRYGWADPGTPTWTPTLTQSGTVTKTVTFAEHLALGKLVWWSTILTVTGSGTSANAVTLGLPVAARSGTSQKVGEGRIVDSGTAANTQNVTWWATSGASTCIALVSANAETGYGVAPANGLAANDLVIASGWYISS